MKLEIEVSELSDLWRDLPDAEVLARRAIEASCALAEVELQEGAEVGVQLASDAQVRVLNRQWRDIDKPTNVLSFPAFSTAGLAIAPMLGDIVLAYETTRDEASAEGKTLSDHAAHLVIHGFLHLLGFDHAGDAEAETMEGLETRILATLGIADPYAPSSQADATR
jgi:probable rRNA maturation factor